MIILVLCILLIVVGVRLVKERGIPGHPRLKWSHTGQMKGDAKQESSRSFRNEPGTDR